MEQPIQVLVTHDWASVRTSTAAYLAHLRPAYAVRAVDPHDLEAALMDGEDMVVVCATLDDNIIRRARGWIILPGNGPNEAFVGAGDTRRSIPYPNFDDIVAAIDDLTVSPVTAPESPNQPTVQPDPSDR